MSKYYTFTAAAIEIRENTTSQTDPIIRTITPDDLLRLVAKLDEPPQAEPKPTAFVPPVTVLTPLPEGCEEVEGFDWLCKDHRDLIRTRESRTGSWWPIYVWCADEDRECNNIAAAINEVSEPSRNEVKRFLAAQAARKAAEAKAKEPIPVPPPKVLTPEEAEKLDDHTLYAVWFKAQFVGMRLSEGYRDEIKQGMRVGVAYVLLCDHHTYGDVRKAFERHFAAKGGEK